MEALLLRLVIPLAALVQIGAVLVVVFAFFQASYQAFRLFLQKGASVAERNALRIQLGTWLSIALEFELAADILKTAITPSWDEIGKLAAIIVLRTLLNYFLQRDIEHNEPRPVPCK